MPVKFLGHFQVNMYTSLCKKHLRTVSRVWLPLTNAQLGKHEITAIEVFLCAHISIYVFITYDYKHLNNLQIPNFLVIQIQQMAVCFPPICCFGDIQSSTRVLTGLGVSLHLNMPNAGPDPESLVRRLLQAILHIIPLFNPSFSLQTV